MLEPLMTPQPYANAGRLPRSLGWLAPEEPDQRTWLFQQLLRVLITTNLILGLYYLAWRYTSTIHWHAWPISIALLLAETYSFLDACLFGLMMWRLRRRPPPPPPPEGATVDVFITTYNEPIDLVMETANAAMRIRYPHQTYVLDDGNRPEMRAAALQAGCGYITRTAEWAGKNRHAKSGNLNNALLQTTGEFLLILDADQIPSPEILDRVLGYFHDPRTCFVQTPQWFYNVPGSDPFGCQAPLFYGPIQQGKDGWNAAFFCGSNAVLRRETIAQLGIIYYVREIEQRLLTTLKEVGRSLEQARKSLRDADRPLYDALGELMQAMQLAQSDLRAGQSFQEVTWTIQQRARELATGLVRRDLETIRTELSEVAEGGAIEPGRTLAERIAHGELISRTASPLAAVEEVRAALLRLDLDIQDEALPLQPMATISVTEDMATAMRMHAHGWTSVYHDEIMARGLAPDDLRSALQQRLRWAQGTIQVMLRENPLFVSGLSPSQRLMYAATMWSYLSGWFGPVYIAAPILYLVVGLAPTRAESQEFLWRLLPFLVINQLVFVVVSWGRPTWRGQQYSLALFPLWIQSVTSAVSNVFLGRKLGFVVTPKTRQDGIHLYLIKPQLFAMGLLVLAVIYGLVRLAFGLTDDGLPIVVNLFWASYDLIMLSAVIDAAIYQPEVDEPPAAEEPTPLPVPGAPPAETRVA